MEYHEEGLGENSNGMEQNTEGEFAGEYEDSSYPTSEFNMINSVVGDGIHKDRDIGLSVVSFDNHEELLWIGTKSGHVTSYAGTQLQKYTSFQVHPTEEVRNLITIDQGILALTQTGLRYQMRRGIPIFTHSSSSMTDMHSLAYNTRNHRLLMGGMQEKLIEFDLSTQRETRVETIAGGSCAIIREHGRFLCCGDATAGKIHLRDPRSLGVQHTLDAHTGSLSDFDVLGNHLVTCGQSLRHGMVQADRFLMVYDLRIMRCVSPIQTMVPPYQLRFLPALTSRIAVLSIHGQVQLVDTAAVTAPQLSIFQVQMPDQTSAISMDISQSNQCLAFGDSSNYLHLFSSNESPTFNLYAREIEYADTPEPLPPMDINDPLAIYSSVPRPFLPAGQTSYASDFWPERFMKEVYRPTPEVDPEILRTMKIVGTVGYARKVDNRKRNQVNYPNIKLKESRERESGSNRQNMEGEDGSSSLAAIVPKAYRKVAVKYGKMGIDEFDFDRYNRTNFCGLEASLPNSYCNAMLQILYFTEKLRIFMLNHTCERENCVCCELSFLFHMMDISGGCPCQSGNFLRAMRTIPEASALGLIFSDQNNVWKTNVPRLIQSWNRFLLHQISVQKDAVTNLNAGQRFGSNVQEIGQGSASSDEKAEEEDGGVFDAMYGMKQEKANHCSKCKVTVSTEDTVLMCNLVYPENMQQQANFIDIVSTSLCPEQSTPAWCDKCKKYQPTLQTRKLRSLPNILSLNAGMDNAQDIDFWMIQQQHLYDAYKPAEEEKKEEEEPKRSPAPTPVPPPNVKPCRYGLGCNRPDCKFWHPKQDGVPHKEVENVGDKLSKLGRSWIPQEMVLNRHKDGKVTSGESEADEDVQESVKYELFAVCSVILDPSTGAAHNIVAAVNVGPFYHARCGSPVSQWYILNDFSISIIRPEEAMSFNLKWKLPCLLFYQAVGHQTACLEKLSFTNPITSEVFCEDTSLAQKGGRKRITFSPLGPEEMPKDGDLVAIDAEFVTLNQEESELRSDGKVSTIKAAQMSVARITCVRGGGPAEGEPFIDDYISTQEQVVDYVTKFSGIMPGDLDANYSSKHLTTLKSTYKKLRYLVDTGCIFIGHGLKNDFKVINLVVPIEQVIDTVHIFHQPHSRMVSLKFLSWFFLGKKIQGITHDSIEDAVTALQLYKKSLKLKEQGTFHEELNRLYDKGKDLNWKVPEDE